MKWILITCIALFCISCTTGPNQQPTKEEQVYKVQLANWTERLLQQMSVYRTRTAIIDVMQLRDELHDVTPPTRYFVTHAFIQQAADYAFAAVSAYQKDDEDQAIVFLGKFQEAMAKVEKSLSQ